MQQNQGISSGSTETTASRQSQHFLFVSVADAVKAGNGVHAYISYKVITKGGLGRRKMQRFMYLIGAGDFEEELWKKVWRDVDVDRLTPASKQITSLLDYQEPEKIVVRRYSDFVWLHDRLFERYKGIFIPPLPEKSATEKFRFSAEFIEMRPSHHEVRQSDDLRLFLQAHEDVVTRAVKWDRVHTLVFHLGAASCFARYIISKFQKVEGEVRESKTEEA
ncbi:hypothetical protein Cgig2_022518 [Carnegiea gigantea]|uniref:PX domain-containing protein n=1 Tax=Carnegiea gigantea TaxID=171969 RepID=A0A9Q1GQL9_9CARY|nr:hypothetical protein Cgig2_022518 [Carnegiea gigantea]